jgi:putative phage-type endonuclease
MGESKYKTPLALWEERKGIRAPQATNWAMARGNNMEDDARKHFELLVNVDMPPALVIHPEFDFLRASLDGWNAELQEGLEIKCPGKVDHATAVAGEVPKHYYAQVQHQIMVTNAKAWNYWSFDGERGALVRVLPDAKYIKKLMAAEKKFWELLKGDTPPDFTDADYHEDTDPVLTMLCNNYEMEKRDLEKAEERLKALKDQITARVGHPRVKCGNIRIAQITKKGAIDYSKIEVLKGLDLEHYRKKAITYFDVRVRKEENAEG